MMRAGYVRNIQGNDQLPAIEGLGLEVCGGIVIDRERGVLIPGVGPARRDLILGDAEDIRALIMDLEDALQSLAFIRVESALDGR